MAAWWPLLRMPVFVLLNMMFCHDVLLGTRLCDERPITRHQLLKSKGTSQGQKSDSDVAEDRGNPIIVIIKKYYRLCRIQRWRQRPHPLLGMSRRPNHQGSHAGKAPQPQHHKRNFLNGLRHCCILWMHTANNTRLSSNQDS